MKRKWLLYVLFLAAAVVWVSFYGGVLPYLFLYAVLILPLAAVVYIFYVCRTIRFFQGPDSHLTTKGESFAFPIILENIGPLPIVSLRLVLEKEICRIPGFDDDRTWTLLPGQRLSFQTEASCLYAGAYPIGVRKLIVRDCFGFFTYTFGVPTEFRAIVRPQITDRAEVLLNMEHVRSAMELNNPYLTEDTLGNEFREYRRGDSIRHIHWKNSAKTQKLLVRRPEPRQLQRLSLLLLPEEPPENLDQISRRDYFLELAVSVADYFSRQHKSIVFYYPKQTMQTMVVDSDDSFLTFYQRLPDEIASASVRSMDTAAWLAAHGEEDGSLILMLREDLIHTETPPLSAVVPMA